MWEALNMRASDVPRSRHFAASMVLLFGVAACDSVLSGTVVRAPASGSPPTSIADASVGVRCAPFRSEGGAYERTDERGAFSMSSEELFYVAGADSGVDAHCKLAVSKPGFETKLVDVGSVRVDGRATGTPVRQVRVELSPLPCTCGPR